jgi:lipopolysaccharide biosynthesis glycosyltransferase
MVYFSTYFDINYLPRALCMLDSLEQHCESFMIYTLCLDDICLERMKKLGRPYVVPIGLAELEAAVTALAPLKNERTSLEYYYTCGPAFLYFLMERYSEIDLLTYLDADLYFLSDPLVLFDQFEKYSIGVVPHHMPGFRKVTSQGKYNVGWINFRRDANGLACLSWWRDRCIEWCFERYEDGKYADQLYLDQWPKLFEGFYEFTCHGANVGAWNVGDYQIALRSQQVYVDEDPLIFYHFHGFKKIRNNLYNTNLGITKKPPSSILKKYVFAEYIELLEKHSGGRAPTNSIREYYPKFYIIKRLAHLSLGILFREYIIYFKGRVY